MKNFSNCFLVAGAALLAACATPAPAPAPTAPQNATATSDENFKVPVGFFKAKVKGEDKYCRTDVDTGSRITRTTTCYTLAQLKAEQTNDQNSIANGIQGANSLNAVMGVHQTSPSGR